MSESICYHCGDNVIDKSIVLEDKAFCCTGCKSVYQLLKANDLDSFYKIDRQAGQRPKEIMNTNTIFQKSKRFETSLSISKMNRRFTLPCSCLKFIVLRAFIYWKTSRNLNRLSSRVKSISHSDKRISFFPKRLRLQISHSFWTKQDTLQTSEIERKLTKRETINSCTNLELQASRLEALCCGVFPNISALKKPILNFGPSLLTSRQPFQFL